MKRVRRPICPLPPASDPLRALVWGNRSAAGAGLAAAQVTHDVDARDEHVGKQEGGHAAQHSIRNGGDGGTKLPG